MTALAIDDAALRTQAVTRTHGKSFYLASHVLGGELRRDAYTLYAFLRRFDDAVDEPIGFDANLVVSRGTAFVRALAEGNETAGIVPDVLLPSDEAAAMTALVRKHALPTAPLVDFLRGLGDDLSFRQPKTDAELDVYCYRVAGTVGVLMAWMFGVRDVIALHAAKTLGNAMQLTNVLRDVREDLGRGRVYLPQRALDDYGVDASMLARAPHDARVRTLISAYVERARRLYEEALPGIDAIPAFRARACVSVMAHVYAGILDELEQRGFAPAERATVPSSRRVTLACTAVLTTSVWSRRCS